MMWPIELLSHIVGVPEPALRLLLSVLLGFPLAYVYRRHVYQLPKLQNQLYMIASGVLILLFNFGCEAYHTLLAIGMSYVFIKTLTGTPLIVVTFVFHMVYLLAGYIYTSTDTYTISWTMPHCVLVLRLIGLSFDVSDGRRPVEELSLENKKSCLSRVPDLIEVYAFALFPASLLIGPQFPFRRFERFIGKEFDQYKGNVEAGIRRGLIGMAYLALNQVGSTWIPDDYLLSDEYTELCLVWRWLLLGAWAKFTMYKYISVWLLCEGAATCFGLTFVGVDETTGQEDWSGCANIKLAIFENATRFQHFIDSFNVNTNHWTAEYVYKRLKFLNNRQISQAAALLFLAVWHGFHTGYYMCFLMEFTIMQFEKAVQPAMLRHVKLQQFAATTPGMITIWVALKLYTMIGLGYSLVPLALLTTEKWWTVYKAVGLIGFVFFGPWSTWLFKAALRATDGPRPQTE